MLLVVGAVGTGKSSLIIRNMDEGAETKPRAGNEVEGVTSTMTGYMGTCGNVRVKWIDTPGVGDQRVKPWQLVSELEQYLQTTDLDGVLLLLPCGDRENVGFQIVRLLLKQGFMNSSDTDQRDPYENIIIVGTKADIAFKIDPLTQKAYKKEQRQEARAQWRKQILENFFDQSKGEQGKLAMVAYDDDNDDNELVDCIKQLPEYTLRFQKPEARTLASGIADIIGCPEEEAFAAFEEARAETECNIIKGYCFVVREEYSIWGDKDLERLKEFRESLIELRERVGKMSRFSICHRRLNPLWLEVRRLEEWIQWKLDEFDNFVRFEGRICSGDVIELPHDCDKHMNLKDAKKMALELKGCEGFYTVVPPVLVQPSEAWKMDQVSEAYLDHEMGLLPWWFMKNCGEPGESKQ